MDLYTPYVLPTLHYIEQRDARAVAAPAADVVVLGRLAGPVR